MLAVDSSTLIPYLAGEQGSDIDALDIALQAKQVALPPVVLCEMLSDPKVPGRVSKVLKSLPQLAIGTGYWERAGLLRAKILAQNRKARLADALIVQVCLDHDVPLIARDRDFRNFARVSNLKLLP
jgi:predicted nucleic acid-binding protein